MPSRRDAVSLPRPWRVERGADPGRRPQRKRGAIERGLPVDLGEPDLGDHRVLGERGRAHEVPDRLAVAGQARRAVRKIALVLHVPDGEAEADPGLPAVDALVALRGEEGDDMVAGLDERDAPADGLDHARAFVPEHRGHVAGRIRARRRVEVGVADPAGDEANKHLARLRLCELELLDDERAPEVFEDAALILTAGT